MEIAWSISRADIAKIMERGDAKTLKIIFKTFQLSGKNDRLVRLLPNEREILTEILSTAAVQATNGNLKEEVAWAIINHVSIVINVFPFLHKLTYIHSDSNFSIISGSVIEAISESSPSPEVFGEIEAMSSFELFALINFIAKSGKIRSLDATFIQPIIRRLYGEEFVSSDLLFALMATYLDQPIEMTANIADHVAHQIVKELLDLENNDEGKD